MRKLSDTRSRVIGSCRYMISFRYCTQPYANVKALQVRLRTPLILKWMPRLFLCYLFDYYYTSLRSNNEVSATSHCVVPKNIHTPPPPLPRRALLLKTPTPIEFPFQGVLVIPPTPWNFCYYSTWLGTLCKEYLFQKCCCTLLLRGR